jgi:hypothetical protein
MWAHLTHPPRPPYTHNDNFTYINSKIDHPNTPQFKGATSKHGLGYGGGIQWETSSLQTFDGKLCHG